MKAKDFTTVMLIAGLMLFAWLYFDSCTKRKQDAKDSTELINALNDTVTHFKNKDGENVARISVMQTESAKDFLKIISKDSTIISLQATVKEYKSKLKQPGSSVTQGTIQTDVKNTNPTNISKSDTVRIDSLVYIYPTYSDSLMNKWIEYRASMNKDSSTFSLSVKNDFTTVIGTDKGKAFVDVITDNPYSTVKKLRVFQTDQPKKKKWGIGPSGGVTYNFITGKVEPYIGVGLSYNLIRL